MELLRVNAKPGLVNDTGNRVEPYKLIAHINYTRQQPTNRAVGVDMINLEVRELDLT